jgi:serine protease AprX
VTSVVREREDAGDETEGDELEGGAAGLGGGFGPEALEESALEGMELPAFSSDATYDAVVRDVRYLTAVREFLEKQSGVTIEDAGGDTVRFTAPKDSGAIRAVARLPTVKLVAEFKPPTLLCNSGRSAIGLDRHDSAAVVLFPWTGKGVTVGVLDSGVDRAHPDVDPAVKQEFRMPGALPADTIGHGTHVAGIIAGRGVESGGKVVGAATGADLVVTWMVDTAGKLILPADYQALFGPPVQAGASILNLSWGTPIGAFYDQGAVQVDRLIYDEFPDTLFVIAAGNYGIALGGSHKFRTIGTPASAKNAITVGAWSAACDQQCCAGVNAAQTWGQKRGQKFPRPPAADELVSPPLPGAVTAISSRGPTDYESIKPDLVAPGQFIESTRATVIDESRFETQVGPTGPKYVCASGTSQAAPFVSGAAAILREYLREVRQTPKSSAALLKAMLIAAARRVPASSAARQAELQAKVGFPDFDQGFGLLDLSTLLPHDKAPANRKVVFIDIDNKGPDALASRQPENSPRRSSRTFEVTVTDGAVDRLRVVLCWTDWPGVHVQNSLQLDVRRPDGKAFLGNQDHIFQKNQDFDQLSIDTGTPLDKRNTVAVVEIASPPPGRYRIRVTANNTPFPIRDPRQGFALVVSGELASERF